MRGWSKQQRKLREMEAELESMRASIRRVAKSPVVIKISAARSVVWTYSACGLVKLRYHRLSAFVSALNSFVHFVLYSLQFVTQEREASLAATIRRVARSPAIAFKHGLEALENGQVVEASFVWTWSTRGGCLNQRGRHNIFQGGAALSRLWRAEN